MKTNQILQGDCLEVMKTMEDNSIDTIITDPPYGISFMGKKWDYDVPSKKIFKEMLRIIKSGGTLMCFAGTRTQHRMAVNIEDSGWILKDVIMFLYGSGFPKATDISKQLDKKARGDNVLIFIEALLDKGDKLKDIGERCGIPALESSYNDWKTGGHRPEERSWARILKGLDISEDEGLKIIETYKVKLGGGNSYTFREGEERDWEVKKIEAKSEEAKLWNGWKSHGLKPAYEPILVAMKPNEGSYAQNALKWGVAGLNIDGGRIGAGEDKIKGGCKKSEKGWNKIVNKNKEKITKDIYSKGRFPANIILDEEAAKMLDEQSGELISGKPCGIRGKDKYGFTNHEGTELTGFGDKGGASRFFYTAKASKAERNAGCEELEDVQFKGNKNRSGGTGSDYMSGGKWKESPIVKNNHPTVKPIKLMEYLCTLTKTPTGGIVLDPFAGSGTTGLACQNTGRDYILIEKEPEYVKIAEARLKENKRQQTLL